MFFKLPARVGRWLLAAVLVSVVAGAIGGAPRAGLGQIVNDNSVGIELRLVNITGTPPMTMRRQINGTIDGRQSGEVLRFRVEYRLQGGRGVPPSLRSGLTGALMNISQVGDGGTLRAAQLTTRENATSAFPIPDIDSTPLVQRRGMNMPFRGGFSNPNDNTSTVNGVASANGLAIGGIVPISLSNFNQGQPGFVDTDGVLGVLSGNEWYGLYTFELVLPSNSVPGARLFIGLTG